MEMAADFPCLMERKRLAYAGIVPESGKDGGIWSSQNLNRFIRKHFLSGIKYPTGTDNISAGTPMPSPTPKEKTSMTAMSAPA